MAGIEGSGAAEGAARATPNPSTRHGLVAAVACVGLLLLTAGADAMTGGPAEAASCPAGSQVAVVAHADDDLLFMNPDMPRRLTASGWCTTTVVITSGDAGLGIDYTRAREDGLRAAYAEMAGVADSWTTRTSTVAGHRVEGSVLDGRPAVRLDFLRLPDGNIDGSGFPSEGDESLQRLREGEDRTVSTIEPSPQTYTAAELRATVGALVERGRPTVIRTLDFVHADERDGDHSDHHEVGLLARTVRDDVAPDVPLVPYLGYPAAEQPANLTPAEVAAKTRTFLTYTPYDWRECWTAEACAARPEGDWLERMHQADGGTDGATAGERRPTPTPAP